MQRATHLSEACSTPQSTKARTLNGLVRRRRRQQSGSFASSVKSASESTRSMDSSAPLPPALDDFERTILQARASGVGRAFGYGTGGMVSGAGAVGISLGSMLRTRDTSMQRPSTTMEATLEEDEYDSEIDDAEEDEEAGIDSQADDSFQQRPLLTPPIGPISPAHMDELLSPARTLSPTRSDQNNDAASAALGLSSPQMRAHNAAIDGTETVALEATAAP